MNQREHQFAGRAEVDPSAGIWACGRCGRRIQVITESDMRKAQPFICVCGAAMRPGEEHSRPDGDRQSRVVDD